jgi:uncharacterized protein YcbX
MIKEIGRVKALYRYPVKSMAGEPLSSAALGWHGFMGDRRFAFIRVGNQTGFPWLTGVKHPQLIGYVPFSRNPGEAAGLPTHVRTPEGRELELRGEALEEELSNAYGSRLELMRLDHGVFDEATVSVINQSTISAVEQETGITLDVRRFRPNVVVETSEPKPFEEDDWVGKIIHFGSEPDRLTINIYMRDTRCAMVNIDPLTGEADSNVMKAVVRMNNNCAGVYASAMKIGLISVGDKVFLEEVGSIQL